MSIQIAVVSVAGRSGRRSRDAVLFARRIIQGPGSYELQIDEPGTTVALAAGLRPNHLGPRASYLALDLLAQRLSLDRDLSERTIFSVQRAMGERAFGTPDIGMATTLAALQIDGNTATIVNVGDSPAYLWRNGCLHQKSVDHTVLRRMLAEGIIDKADAMAAAGHYDNLDSALIADSFADQFEVHELKSTTRPGDLWLLCSRGIRKRLTRPQIAQMVSRTIDAGPGAVAHCLVTAPVTSEAFAADVTVAALQRG